MNNKVNRELVAKLAHHHIMHVERYIISDSRDYVLVFQFSMLFKQFIGHRNVDIIIRSENGPQLVNSLLSDIS